VTKHSFIASNVACVQYNQRFLFSSPPPPQFLFSDIIKILWTGHRPVTRAPPPHTHTHKLCIHLPNGTWEFIIQIISGEDYNLRNSSLYIAVFFSLSDLFHLLIVDVEGECYTWSHSDTPLLGRTPLDQWSARRRNLYLTTHNKRKRQTSMPPAGLEPAIPESGRRPTP